MNQVKIHHQLTLGLLLGLISLSIFGLGLRLIENQIRAELGPKILTIADQIWD